MKRNQIRNQVRNQVLWMCVGLAVWLGLQVPLPGKDENKNPQEKQEKKVYYTQRVNPAAPVIDGHLDEPAWEHSEWGTGFKQHFPNEGEPVSQDTSFKILYDDKNIYVGIRAYDTEAGKIVRRLSRRDSLDGDWVEIILDSYFDQRTAFLFAVSAAGVKDDEFISSDGDNWDNSWDPVWDVATSVDAEGWTAEMRIPLSQLRFGYKDSHTWGLYVGRLLYRKQEISEWQLIPRTANGLVSRFGELRGLLQIRPKRPIELLPYSVGKLEFFEKEEGNPFATGKLSSLAGGLDGKIGITNDFTLDFTINPDFGQVEADPSEVNLTAFESFFPEKRPFFVEGRNILNYNISGGDGSLALDTLFYSRRIGRIPQHEPDIPDDHYMDIPDNTTILGAFKLTGKTRNGLSIGILESVTAKESARIDFNGQRRDETVEPLTNYLVLRVQKEFNQGKTGVGGMFTAVHRNLDLDKDPELYFLHRAAYSGGVDFFHHWKNKEWWFTVKTVFSHVRGDKEAILETQQSSVHNYQRPDADYVTLDPERTSLSGHGGDISFGKTGGGKFQFITGITWRSPGLELNDAGYLRNADLIVQFSWVGYRITKPFSIFNSMNLNLNQFGTWNFGGESLNYGGNVNFSMDFKNNWEMSGGVEVLGNQLSGDALRGGPALMYPGGVNQWFGVLTDPRKKLSFSLSLDNAWRGNSNMRFEGLGVGITYKPFSALSIKLSPSYSKQRQNLTYVDTIEFQDENRYILARLRQKTLAMTIRLDFSLTPDLSIQFYGQPFISSGRYSDFKTIIQPRAKNYYDRFHIYTPEEIRRDPQDSYYYVNEPGGKEFEFENPDFKFLQFRSNLVVRWEYLPGSTVYLVWSQGRTDEFDTDIEFTPGSGLRDLFRIHPYDVFLVKFTYRLKI